MSAFVDDPTKGEFERLNNFKAYLRSIDWESKGMGTIDQAAANWAQQMGFSPSTYMGGRRSGRNHKRSKKTRRHRAKHAKRKMTRSKK
jgi:hypothetical protein